MKVLLEDLRAAFDVVDHVEANAALDCSAYVRLFREGSKLVLSLTGSLWTEAVLKGGDPAKWTAYAERRALKAFLSTSSTKEVELYYAKDKLTLKTDQRLEVQAHAVITGYESWKNGVGAFDLSDEQKEAVRVGERYLPHGYPGIEYAEAVCFRKGYGIIATDTVLIAGFLGIPVKQDFLLPTSVAGIVADGKLAVDGNGVGLIFPSGTLYQPRSVDLDRYPDGRCREVLDEARGLATMMKVKASDILGAFQTASQFFLDKKDDVAYVEPVASGLKVTVDLSSGKFQREIPLVGKCSFPALPLSVRKLIPWLDFAAGKGDPVLECTRTKEASVFRFVDGKATYLLMSADLVK